MAALILVFATRSRFSTESGFGTAVVDVVVTRVACGDADLEFTCIFGGSGGPVPAWVRVETLGSWPTDELGRLAFPFRLASATCANFGLSQFDLVHHGLPFALLASFSLVGGGQVGRRGQVALVGASLLRVDVAAIARAPWPLFAPGLG